MIAKEKAVELIGKFNFTHDKVNGKFLFHQTLDESKRCALIAVDLMIYHTEQDSNNISLYEFYLEVKQEIYNFAQELKLEDIQI
jgi:hypothetical protein